MAGLLNNAVVVLVLITVAKPFIAADEDTSTEAPTARGQENTTSALQEASQEPNETARRDDQLAGRYEVELCNPFYEFWANHTFLWTLRTSDSMFLKCKRQEHKDLNATGVLLTQLSRSDKQTISHDYYWRFGEDDAIYYHSKGCSNYGLFKMCYDFRVKQVLEYQSSTNNCSVVRIEEWHRHSEQDKGKYLADCQRSNDSWCMCNSTVDAQEKTFYYCRNRPFYELATYGAPTENVPEDCKAYYDKQSVLYRDTDSQVYEKDCEDIQQRTST